MTIRIRCGGDERSLTYPRFMTLKFDMLGGVKIIGPGEGEPVEEFDLGGVHFGVYDDVPFGDAMDVLLENYNGHLLMEVTINGVEIRYTK